MKREHIRLLEDSCQKLILKLLESPISVKDLPLIDNLTRDQALWKLYDLEDMGICTSKMETLGKKEDGTYDYYRVFYPTKLVDMKEEARKINVG